MDNELEVISAEAVVANLISPRHLFAFEGRRKKADCVESGSTMACRDQKATPLTTPKLVVPSLGFTTKFLYAFIIIITITYLLQLSCHSVAVVLTLVQTKQIRINIHKRNHTKSQ